MNVPQCVLDRLSSKKDGWEKIEYPNETVFNYKNKCSLWISKFRKDYKYEYSYYSFYGIIREDISIEEAKIFILNKTKEYIRKELKELE